MTFRSWLIACLLMFLPALAHAQWQLELTKDASFIIRYDGATVVRSKYVAWGPNWKFADFETAIGKNEGDQWSINGEIKDLKLAIGGQIKQSANVSTFTWNLNAAQGSKGNVGGGMTFDVRLDKQVFGPNVAKPQIDGSSWSWTPKAGQTVSIRFDGMKSNPFFEKGKADDIRAFFIPSEIEAGSRTVTMTITLPEGGQRVDGVSRRYAAFDEATWQTKTIDWTTSPIDLSYLNDKPAGAKGFVRADGERLVYGDGSEAKFWGTNVMAYALFNATDEAIQQQAKRIAALGYNLVRIHHHDSADWSPSVFPKDGESTKVFDEKNLERIDYWVKCLKDEGVYVWMDLHVGRPFRSGDGIEGYDELKSTKAGRSAKGFNYVNKSVTDRMKEFATAYLTHKNAYTGIRYVDEPAVMGVLITNENDITQHFGNEMLPNKNKPIHQKWIDALRKNIVGERGLDAANAWKFWEAGPSKVVLNQIEYDWNKDFIAHLRSIGLKVPIATTNTWGANPLFSLPSLTAGDVIDVHSYGSAESLSSSPKYDDMSSHWIAAAQVAGMPLVITEWNTESPQRDRFTQPLFIASQAAFQGWDAPMIYGYQQAPLVAQTKIDNFGTSNDPAHISLMPAAALIFRRGDVKVADRTVVYTPGEAIFNTALTPENSPALRTISERHRLVIGMPKTPLLPWLKGVDRGDASDPNPIAEGTGETSITSDTGELKRDWKEGVYTINTPRTQAVMGWVGGKEFELADVRFNLATPKAAVVVTSLDNEPIAKSKKMLLTFTAQTHVSGKPAVVRSEPVTGIVRVKGPVSIEPLSPSGKVISKKSSDGAINLDGKLPTHWYIITREE